MAAPKGNTNRNVSNKQAGLGVNHYLKSDLVEILQTILRKNGLVGDVAQCRQLYRAISDDAIEREGGVFRHYSHQQQAIDEMREEANKTVVSEAG